MPGLKDMVMGMIGQRIGPYDDKLSDLRTVFGTPSNARTYVDMARGAMEGPIHPMFQGMSPSDLALYDRLAWGSEMKDRYGPSRALLSSMLMGGGYEGVKGLQQSGIPGLSSLAGMLMGGVGSGLGGANVGHMQSDATTS